MKIEMGESLFYSWLRHVKECQIVQTNWKVSQQWILLHEDDLEQIKTETDKFFAEKYGYAIYKKNASLSQIIQQGECDALGISISGEDMMVYAVDVAFHEGGLNYGSRDTTVMKIINKCLRTAMCIYGYLNTKEAEIIFASPKINRAVLNDALPCILDTQELMSGLGFAFRFRIIANEDFRDIVLNPILLVSGGIADTSELFLRSYQMLQMFKNGEKADNWQLAGALDNSESYEELKIGKLVQTVLRDMLEKGCADEKEIEEMRTAEYSKQTFDIQWPLLVRQDCEYDRKRYYTTPVEIRGVKYMLCSQWFEVETNNDRPYLQKWIEEHKR